MEKRLNLKNKKLMSIVIMIIIMYLTLLLLLTNFAIEYMYIDKQEGNKQFHVDSNAKPDIDKDDNKNPDINVDVDDDKKEDFIKPNPDSNHNGKQDINIDNNIDSGKNDLVINALKYVLTPSELNLNITKEQLKQNNYGNSEYLTIDSIIRTGSVNLISYADTTTCKYNIKFVTNYNYFENKYLIDGNNMGTLTNQLILELNGYDMNKNERISKTIDLISIKDKETILLKDVIIKNKKNKKNIPTIVKWNFKLSFRNYRDYDQTNNAGAKANGNLIFEITSCERTR